MSQENVEIVREHIEAFRHDDTPALYTLIDGKIARITVFPGEDQALEAVGLRE